MNDGWPEVLVLSFRHWRASTFSSNAHRRRSFLKNYVFVVFSFNWMYLYCIKMLPSWRMLCAKRLNYFSLRRRTISLSDLAFLLRVLRPSAGLPHGVDGALRQRCFTPPPPCGWSLRFIGTTNCWAIPFQRLRPALPKLINDCCSLPTVPIVARHVPRTNTNFMIEDEQVRIYLLDPKLEGKRQQHRISSAPLPGFEARCCG